MNLQHEFKAKHLLKKEHISLILANILSVSKKILVLHLTIEPCKTFSNSIFMSLNHDWQALLHLYQARHQSQIFARKLNLRQLIVRHQPEPYYPHH